MDTTFSSSSSQRLSELLEELRAPKLGVKKRAEILSDIRGIYETHSGEIYSQADEDEGGRIDDILEVVMEAAQFETRDNESKKEKKAGGQRLNAIHLLQLIFLDISRKPDLLEEDHGILKNVLCLLSKDTVRSDELSMRQFSDIVFNLLNTVGVQSVEEEDLRDLWFISWKILGTSVLTDYAAWNYLRILTKIVAELSKTVLSLRLEESLGQAIERFFETVEKSGSTSWPMRVNAAVLDFINVLMDNFGLLFRDQIMDRLFKISTVFLPRLSVDSTEQHEQIFFDKLSNLAFPDCHHTSFVDQRIFGLASMASDSLLSDLSQKSITRPGFVLSTHKAVLLAKLLVISQFHFEHTSSPSTSKRSKIAIGLESLLDELVVTDCVATRTSVLVLLEQVVKGWSHRLCPDILNRIVDTVLKLDKKSVTSHLNEYCRLLAELVKSGALGNSNKVKTEASLTNPMRDPRVTVKSLWKQATTAAHSSTTSESAMSLMMVLVKNFKDVLAPEEDDQLVETISSVLTSITSQKMLDLLSLLLTTLEFDELKSFSGGENKESGVRNWTFRCQIAERLIGRVQEDFSGQLYQLCCYHPQPNESRTTTSDSDTLTQSLRTVGLVPVERRKEPGPEDKKLATCLIHEVVEYVVNLLLDRFTQDESPDSRLSLFTVIFSFCGLLHNQYKTTGTKELMTMVTPLLQTVNEWLFTYLQTETASELLKLNPGHGSRFVSLSNRRVLQEKYAECSSLYSRFPTDQEVPAAKMKQFLSESVQIITRYGDFLVSVQFPNVKEESGTHRLLYRKVVSFSSFLANRTVSFIEESLNFLPDVFDLYSLSKEVLTPEHTQRIVNKADAIIAEDEADDSENETLLKKKLCRETFQGPLYNLVSHCLSVGFGSVLTEEKGLSLIRNQNVSLVIRQSLVKKFLDSQEGVDGPKVVALVRKDKELLGICLELFPDFLLYEKAFGLEATILQKLKTGKKTEALSLLKNQAETYCSLNQGHRFAPILQCFGSLLDSDYHLVSLISSGIAVAVDSLQTQKVLFPLLQDLVQKTDDRSLFQMVLENWDDSLRETVVEKENKRVCQGLIDRILSGGQFQKTYFVLTKMFWNLLKESLSVSIVQSLEKSDHHLYDEILFYWDVLPRLRENIAELLVFFDQSREDVTRRGNKESGSPEERLESLKKTVEWYCSLRVADSRGEKDCPGEVKSCWKVLLLSEQETVEFEESQRSSQTRPSSSPCLVLVHRLLKLLKSSDQIDEEYSTLLDLLGQLSWTPIFYDIIAPSLCSLSPDSGTILFDWLSIVQNNSSWDQRLLRTVAECVDGCGLDNLSNLTLDPKRLILLGHLLLSGDYHDHAFVVANLAFDRLLAKQRNLAGYGGPIPTDENLWQLLGMVYLRTKNCEALDSLPRQMQDHINVQLIRASSSQQWLQVAHSPVATDEEKIRAKWFCGIETHAKGSDQKYMDAVISGKWDVGYPKKLGTHHKRLYAVIRNQNQCEKTLLERIRKLYLTEIAASPTVPSQKCREFFELEILSRDQLSESFLVSLPLEELSLLMWKMYRHCLSFGGPDATLSFSDYQECFQVCALLLLDKLRKSQAYMAALSIIPIVQSVVKQDRIALMRLTVKECEIHMEMGHHQLAENKLYSLSNSIELRETQEEHKVPTEEVDVGIDVVCLLSKIRAEHSRNVEQAMVPLKALNTCNMTNDRAAQHVYSMALRQLQEMEAFMASPMIKLRKEARDRHKKDLQQLRYSGSINAEDQRRQRVIGKEYSCEHEELTRLDQNLDQAACFALQSAVDLLEFICNGVDKQSPIPEQLKDKILRVLFPLIDLIFRYEDNKDVTVIFKSNMTNFPIALWLPTVPHILPHCFRDGPLSNAICSLMVQLLVAYPFHTVIPLLSYKFNENKLSERAQTVDSLLQKATKAEARLEPVVKDLVEAHTVYREFVWLPLKKDNVAAEFEMVKSHKKEKYKISQSACLFSKIDLLRRVPIPTVNQPVGEARDYRHNTLILWAHIDHHCDKADGQSSPKIIRVKGSNGLVYKMVWKDGESVRQDSLVQDLFSVMSSLLETEQPLRTYNVVPLDSMSGIIEFCGGTQSMKDLLIGTDSRAGLHKEICPTEDIYAVRKKMNQKQMQERQRISVEKFKEFLGETTPVFRYHFYRSFPKVHDWTRMIKNYTKSLAQWSIVCYVVGLGDRHGSNVLFETKTSQFVHIDLGMILEFSRRMLPIPELVPFRLTRDLLDPILVQGIKGNLAYEAADALDRMRKNKDVILGAASVFLRETVSNFKDTADDKTRSFASATAFGRLQAKLNGTDQTISPASAFDQTQRLLSEATSIENMAKLFHGWLAIL